VYELVDGIIGDRYPGPDRICSHVEQILREYLADELLEGTPPPGDWDLFAVEGGTAAICYVFDSLATNFLLRPGDRIALMVPAFTPYLEIPRLDRYHLDVIEINASAVDGDGDRTWQFPDSEIDKLADPAVKALFVVNPSNPPSVMLAPATLDRITEIVQTRNPGLIIVTDDVYGTFVPGFRSLMDVLPRTRSPSTRSRSTSVRPDGGWASSRSTATASSTGPSPRCRPATSRCSTAATSRSPPPRATSASSTGWSPTAGRSRSTTPPASRSRSRCR